MPHVSVVIGEGGSGGALAIDVCDYRIMLDKAYYSVISISGAAAIIARDRRHISEIDMDRAAKNLRITADSARSLGVVDWIVKEPAIGARKKDTDLYRDVREAVIEGLHTVKKNISPFFIPDSKIRDSWKLRKYQVPALLRKRYRKYKKIGVYHTSISDKVRHFMGELYRIKWVHTLFTPLRKT